MTKTLNQFIRAQYETTPNMKKYYGSFDKFKVNFVANHGFGNWLETLRGQELNLRQTKSLVMSYMKYGDRKTSDLPAIFGYLVRLFDIKFPIVEGIFTSQYWDKVLNAKTIH